MCGIAGLIGIDRDLQAKVADKMLAAMSHRGPDASGKIVLGDGSVTLLHARLAIIDLSPAGNQPMRDRDDPSRQSVRRNRGADATGAAQPAE